MYTRHSLLLAIVSAVMGTFNLESFVMGTINTIRCWDENRFGLWIACLANTALEMAVVVSCIGVIFSIIHSRQATTDELEDEVKELEEGPEAAEPTS